MALAHSIQLEEMERRIARMQKDIEQLFEKLKEAVKN